MQGRIRVNHIYSGNSCHSECTVPTLVGLPGAVIPSVTMTVAFHHNTAIFMA